MDNLLESLAVMIVTSCVIPILVFFFLLRSGSQFIIYHNAAKHLGENGLLPGLMAYDFLFAFLTPFQRLMGRMSKGAQ